MQLFATLLLTANLAISALAAPLASTSAPSASTTEPIDCTTESIASTTASFANTAASIPSTTAPFPSTTAPIPGTTALFANATAPFPSTTASSGNNTNGSSSSCDPDFLCGTQTGQGTFYAPALGACGIDSSPDQLIVSVSFKLFDSYPGYKQGDPNTNPVCGRKINANFKGKSVTVTVVDRCTGCDETSLDFSPAAFDQLADPSVGRIDGMTWSWAS